MKYFSLLTLFIVFSAHTAPYPPEWWLPVDPAEAASWEILPQEAKAGEVILSKRNELGLFSNFAATPFCLDRVCYASVEGLWQSLKYPDPNISADPRHNFSWPHSREEVEKMVSFEAKVSGDEANIIYKKNKLTHVSYQNHFFNYNDYAEGSAFHYKLIKKAILAKLTQNPEVMVLLNKTKGLILKPDHFVNEKYPASYHYYKILMEIRDQENLDP